MRLLCYVSGLQILVLFISFLVLFSQHSLPIYVFLFHSCHIFMNSWWFSSCGVFLHCSVHIDGFMGDCDISVANALEVPQSCTDISIDQDDSNIMDSNFKSILLKEIWISFSFGIGVWGLVGYISALVLWLSELIWWHRTGSKFSQLMVCCLTAPSHYLNQRWLIISKVPWHSSERIIIRRSEDTNQ